jgi:hypothetical protein
LCELAVTANITKKYRGVGVYGRKTNDEGTYATRSSIMRGCKEIKLIPKLTKHFSPIPLPTHSYTPLHPYSL